jgi:hypothetical protein
MKAKWLISREFYYPFAGQRKRRLTAFINLGRAIAIGKQNRIVRQRRYIRACAKRFCRRQSPRWVTERFRSIGRSRSWSSSLPVMLANS